jgi:hypothetical protein
LAEGELDELVAEKVDKYVENGEGKVLGVLEEIGV